MIASQPLRHRSLYVLSGPRFDGLVEPLGELVEALTKSSPASSEPRCLYLSPGDSPATLQDAAWDKMSLFTQTQLVTNRSVHRVLGSEADLVVFNAFAGFDSDTLAAITGSIAGGGHLLMLTPPLDSWHRQISDESHSLQPSFFIQRFARQLQGATRRLSLPLRGLKNTNQVSSGIELLELMSQSPPVQVDQYSEQNTLLHRLSTWLATEQNAAIASVILLTADRGRGKSATLGRLLARHTGNALVCAPRKKAVGILYQHFSQANHSNQSEPGFCAPDQLATTATTDLLIVDEAAGIPLPMLRMAATRFRKVIFSSTVQGYEGAGRGFALRFGQLLLRDAIEYREESLSTPMRWLPDDPLERFIHSSLLLNAPLPILSTGTQRSFHKTRPAVQHGTDDIISELKMETVTAEQLINDEKLLRSAYGLLVQAHYRTTPSDLLAMLDGTNLSTHLLYCKKDIVAAALIATEGPINSLPLRQAILTKQRRPKGHLLPQLLAQYTMRADAFDRRYARIVRIAVTPQLQGVGIGSTFLQLLQQYCLKSEKLRIPYNMMGAMFSAVPDTLNFWIKNGYQPIHLGYRKQTSSGYASVTILKNLHDERDSIQTFAAELYEDMLAFKNGHTLKSHTNDFTHPRTDTALFDRFIIQRYVCQQRSFHDSQAAISRVARRLTQQTARDFPLNSQLMLLLRACEEPTATLRAMSEQLGANSQSDVEKSLREILQQWLTVDPNNE